MTPGDFGVASNLFEMVYLNPGDTLASVTAIGATGGGDVFIGNSQTILGGVLPITGFTFNDLEIRLDMEGELGTTSPNLDGQGGASGSTPYPRSVHCDRQEWQPDRVDLVRGGAE